MPLSNTPSPRNRRPRSFADAMEEARGFLGPKPAPFEPAFITGAEMRTNPQAALQRAGEGESLFYVPDAPQREDTSRTEALTRALAAARLGGGREQVREAESQARRMNDLAILLATGSGAARMFSGVDVPVPDYTPQALDARQQASALRGQQRASERIMPVQADLEVAGLQSEAARRYSDRLDAYGNRLGETLSGVNAARTDAQGRERQHGLDVLGAANTIRQDGFSERRTAAAETSARAAAARAAGSAGRPLTPQEQQLYNQQLTQAVAQFQRGTRPQVVTDPLTGRQRVVQVPFSPSDYATVRGNVEHLRRLGAMLPEEQQVGPPPASIAAPSYTPEQVQGLIDSGVWTEDDAAVMGYR